MRIIAGTLVILFLTSSSAFATSIVAVKDGDVIVIGADSKTTLTSEANAVGEAGSISKCKIVQAGNLFFASAGYGGIGRTGSPCGVDPEYDLKDIITGELRGNGSISDKMGNLEKVLGATLTRIAEKARKDNAAFFLTGFAKHFVYTIIVGGLDNGELILLARTFRLVIAPSGALTFGIGRFSCPGDCQESSATIFEGRTEAIRNYLEQHKLFLYFADPVTAVRDLVGLEISEDPSFVGPPIDILRLTRRGVEWIQKKPLCPDIQENPLLPAKERVRG
jgi:hypothetical protein